MINQTIRTKEEIEEVIASLNGFALEAETIREKQIAYAQIKFLKGKTNWSDPYLKDRDDKFRKAVYQCQKWLENEKYHQAIIFEHD